MTDAPLPWEQQPTETPPAYAAFRIYRDMAPHSSIRATARELGIQRSQVEKWSRQYEWGKRQLAYIRAEDKAARAEQHAERKKMTSDHLAISKALIAKGLTRLTQLDPVQIKPAEAARFIALGVELEVKARGYCTESLEDMVGPALAAIEAPPSDAQPETEAKAPTLKLYSFDDELASGI